jgi:hypothetical protein
MSLSDAYTRRTHDSAPKVGLLFNEFTHCGDIERARLDKDGRELRLRIGLLHCCHDRPIELVSNRRWRLWRSRERVKRGRSERAHAAFVDRWHIRKKCDAMERGDGDDSDITTSVERHECAHISEHDVDMSTGKIGNRRFGAAIGYVHHIHTRLTSEQFHGQM